MRKRLLPALLVIILALAIFSPALAQSYSFQVPKLTVDVYWNSDGTEALDYVFVFANDPSGHVIDYVDLGLPNSNYSDSDITASVNGNQVNDISSSGFQGTGGSGVAIGLGNYSIAPGSTGTVTAHVAKIRDVLYQDTQDSNYASAVFSQAFFGSNVVSGKTDMTVTFHLPPGMKSEEPRWHTAPSGFPSQPETGIDSSGRIYYTWHNANANDYTQYTFGASFPKTYIPAGSIVTVPPPSAGINFNFGAAILPILCIGGFVVIVVAGLTQDTRRKQQYLPPKISIEGHGIKRGLTAVEAAILLEQPLDKVMTMILFSVVKKNLAEVITRDPLEIKVNQPLPADLQPYESEFLAAFQKTGPDRQSGLRVMVVNLVKIVAEKMKGFSRAESIAYYQDITKRAWEQVAAANTPEVKSQKYEEVMEWTMLDKNYEGRTTDVFRNMPVFIPMWWGHYDPTFGRAGSAAAPASLGGGAHVAGADFTKSITTGVQTFSSKVVGNINDFTSRITSVTNPPPKVQTSSSKGGTRSGGGGCVCACACACAGCACACAGGGR